MPEPKLPSVALRAANEGDFERIHRLRVSPEVSAVSRRGDGIQATEYAQELAAAVADPDADLIVIEADDEPAGYVRIERRDEHEYEIGIALEAWARGRGIGRRAIAQATLAFRERRPSAKLVALVRTDNAASARAFVSAGYASRGSEGGFDVYVASE